MGGEAEEEQLPLLRSFSSSDESSQLLKRTGN